MYIHTHIYTCIYMCIYNIQLNKPGKLSVPFFDFNRLKKRLEFLITLTFLSIFEFFCALILGFFCIR